MPIYIVFCCVNFDGLGDFIHYENIIDKLTCHTDIQFISVILFNAHGKHHHDVKIATKLKEIKGVIYYGTETAHVNIFSQDPQLKHYLEHADQAFYISYEGPLESIYAPLLKPNIPIKYIGEHNAALYCDKYGPKNPYRFNRPLGLGHDNLGNPCYGIKLYPSITESAEEQWAHITQTDPTFSKHLLTCTDASDLNTLLQHHVLMSAYFNRCWDFFEFLRIFTVNHFTAETQSIVIHYSGHDLFEFMTQTSEKKRHIERFFHHGYIKSLTILSSDDTQTIHLNGNQKGHISIQILVGFYLSECSLQRLYRLSKMVAVSGDNTFELAVSMESLPFYCSTNWNFKKPTLNALRDITQCAELDISLQASLSFDIFFNKDSLQTREFSGRASDGPQDMLFRDHDRYIQLPLYEKLNFPAMIEAWPTVAQYIRQHHNFYDRLNELINEGLPVPTQAQLPLSIFSPPFRKQEESKEAEKNDFALTKNTKLI